MSGNASNSDVDYDALNNMTQAELEGDNDFASPLIGRDWDAAHGTVIDAELVADEDIPDSSIGSPLIGNSQGLYSNTTLDGSTIIASDITDSTITQNSYLSDGNESIYGPDSITRQFDQERARTPPNMEWVIGTYPRQYRPISPLPESEEYEDKVFITAPSTPDFQSMNYGEFVEYVENRYRVSNSTDATEDIPHAQVPQVPGALEERAATPPPQDRLNTTAFTGTDVRAATKSMVPQVDASGRPMHLVDENGIAYTSGIFMFQACIMNIVKYIDQNRYRHAHDALYEFCALYSKAASMMKYKHIQHVVDASKEKNDNRGMSTQESHVVNEQIQEHVKEFLGMTELAHNFLEFTPFIKTGGLEVEEARVECLKVLGSNMEEVEGMEKTWRNWGESELLLQGMAQAVYEFGIVCKGRI